MKCPETTEGWLRESIDCYSRCIKEHMFLYDVADPAMFFCRQHLFASDYAFLSRNKNAGRARKKRVNDQVLAWLATFSDRFEGAGDEADFAFCFCYLFANHLLGYIASEKVWEVLGYLCTHWTKAAGWVELPEGLC